MPLYNVYVTQLYPNDAFSYLLYSVTYYYSFYLYLTISSLLSRFSSLYIYNLHLSTEAP